MTLCVIDSMKSWEGRKWYKILFFFCTTRVVIRFSTTKLAHWNSSDIKKVVKNKRKPKQTYLWHCMSVRKVEKSLNKNDWIDHKALYTHSHFHFPNPFSNTHTHTYTYYKIQFSCKWIPIKAFSLSLLLRCNNFRIVLFFSLNFIVVYELFWIL